MQTTGKKTTEKLTEKPTKKSIKKPIKKIYLASPYFHKTQVVVEKRYKDTVMATAELIKQGFNVFSPIVHSHVIAETGIVPVGWDFWKELDLSYIDWCDELYVLMLDGWETSTGVKAEIKYAHSLGKHVSFVRGDKCEDCKLKE